MTPEEIAWIIQNLFVGNRLGRGKANLSERTHVDLRSPIIIVASHGDDITPPQQSLGWVADRDSGVDAVTPRPGLSGLCPGLSPQPNEALPVARSSMAAAMSPAA
jgi:hypothetical protein